MRICFVCTGNICRSPTAEGILRELVRDAGEDGVHVIESAGLADYHVGERPDPRTVATAARRGVRLSSRARHFRRADFARYDLVLAMDEGHYGELVRMRPADSAARVRLLRDFDPKADGARDVPDPYYSGQEVFDEVFDVCDRACRVLLERLRRGELTLERA